MIISWGVCFVCCFVCGFVFISGGDVCNVLMFWGVAGALLLSVFLFILWGNVLLWGDYVIYWE